MAGHTPGPWAVERVEASDRYALEGPNYSVARIEMFGRMKEWPSNARLIAAAPDLIHALKDARRYVESQAAYHHEGFAAEAAHRQLAAIDAAIAKAEKGA